MTPKKNQPLLSIVTPTVGKFSQHWLDSLLAVEGDVEFVIVYPPHVELPRIDDPRAKVIRSLRKGETAQRMFGLLNVTGQFVLALDDDDYVHPQVAKLTQDYFEQFPDSWLLNLHQENIDIYDRESWMREWEELPEIDELEICKKTPETPHPWQGGNFKGLLEIPIAPLNNSIDWGLSVLPWKKRKDMHGIHVENFNNKVWKAELVRKAALEYSHSMVMFRAINWIPSWGMDQAFGLFLQALFFESDKAIGHSVPKPGKIRYIERSDVVNVKGVRFHLSANWLLVKKFPQYGYLWNLIFVEFYNSLRVLKKAAVAYASRMLSERFPKNELPTAPVLGENAQ